jgi:hypothetical protein
MTTSEKDELSPFELDVYWASGRPADAGIERHVERCTRCRAYLESLDVGQAASPPVVAPVALAPSSASATSPAARPRPRRRWALPLAGALALAASAVLVARTTLLTPHDYVAVKGAPGVQLLVHRGGETRIWDGRSPVRPGDSLALRVSCEGLAHVAVAAPAPTEWRRLSADAACPASGDPLPFTLVVDDQPGGERLAVVLSRDALDDGRLRRAIEQEERTASVWVVQLELRKVTETDR